MAGTSQIKVDRESVGVGEWESGRMGEWGSGRKGEFDT